MQKETARSPWTWVPTLYFTQALPYIIVTNLLGAMFTARGVDNATMTFYTQMLYLPWVIKPLWSPVVDMIRTKRLWTVGMQFVVALALVLAGSMMKHPSYLLITVGVGWIIAIASATHDIAADGFYILSLTQNRQAAFVGVRSTFYRLGMIVGGGLMASFAGAVGRTTGDAELGWSATFFAMAAAMFAVCIYHLVNLPRPAADHPVVESGSKFQEFFDTFITFFKKKDIWLIIGFILTFRLGESQLLAVAKAFLMQPVSKGGLGMSLEQWGLSYGTIGVIGLTIGGLLGGYLISRHGLKRCLWLMVFATHVPDLVFVYLATALPQNFYLISACLAVEQFGYGLGFTAMLMYMIMISDGEHKTAHYSICTGLMALGMMVPGMLSGRIQQFLGYQHFFIYVILMTIPAFIMAALVKIDPEFGKKSTA
jgi:PAT family beta-lactamase induction signal transducer AmpG